MSGEDLYSLIDKYYRKSIPAEQRDFHRGQIYSCPSFYFRPEIHVVRAKWVDAKQQNALFELQRISMDEFAKTTHMPLHSPKLQLEADEEFISFRAKMRKVIVFSSKTEEWPLTGVMLRDECYLVVPMFSFHDNHNPKWKLKTRAYGYKELFYLPEDISLGLVEGCVRFSSANVVPKQWLIGKDVCLTKEALECMTAWFHFYLTDVADSLVQMILEYRIDCLKKIDEQFGVG